MALPATGESRWFRRFHPSPEADISLVCLPHAGGTASFYLPLSELLPSTVEALVVQYPGRQDRLREPCVESVPEMARAVFDVLKPLAVKRPVALFGHSMGAGVGFELAMLLERELGTTPLALFASARSAPSLQRGRTIHRLDDAGLVAELRRLSGTDTQILDEPELLQLALPSIRSDYKASETYQTEPGTALRCDIVALTGEADDHVSVEEAASWREHTTGGFDLRVFPGGHFYLADHGTAVAAAITDTLCAPRARGRQTIG
ncbi:MULTISPECIES: thioesterase II family protein [Streptomyces]|uniref:Alpha/beta fold hydrolase n=2 Tax=Streptomyces violaceusniger group TaxID=2839105 RepID=A0ABD5J3Z8_9ACTN|nr:MULTISPECIES: alpha/beta fold hydrolase [Streptomyces]MEE4583072.1 alpha/beta fold hydrolase [Streptomyces sp. DSM 41602]WTA80306.1 alpha/beta fold hydrolase [Streptomyces antimycoticus]KUL47300.1 oleoyl-ACP hydrolase [Streptomyces violaceusniger]QTI88030.1 thioesterase [Streptomyces sp. AgN23]RSS46577.1 thioesterase [Streptomyces sp. WAC05858]